MKRGDLESVIGGRSVSRGRRAPAAHLTAGSPRMQGCAQSPTPPRPVDPPRALGVALRLPALRCCLAGRARAAHVGQAPGPRQGPCPTLDVVDLDGKPWRLEAHRRPGRRPQLLGHLVRAVPARDAVARRHGGAAEAARASSSAPSTTRRRAEVIRQLPRAHAVQGARSCSIPTATRPSTGRRASSRPPC